jgi:hypothetical protein
MNTWGKEPRTNSLLMEIGRSLVDLEKEEVGPLERDASANMLFPNGQRHTE